MEGHGCCGGDFSDGIWVEEDLKVGLSGRRYV